MLREDTGRSEAYTLNYSINLRSVEPDSSFLLQSVVSGDLFEFYVFELYLEQISAEDNVDTRIRYHRTLATPLLPRPVFTENRKSDKMFYQATATII